MLLPWVSGFRLAKPGSPVGQSSSEQAVPSMCWGKSDSVDSAFSHVQISLQRGSSTHLPHQQEQQESSSAAAPAGRGVLGVKAGAGCPHRCGARVGCAGTRWAKTWAADTSSWARSSFGAMRVTRSSSRLCAQMIPSVLPHGQRRFFNWFAHFNKWFSAKLN